VGRKKRLVNGFFVKLAGLCYTMPELPRLSEITGKDGRKKSRPKNGSAEECREECQKDRQEEHQEKV